MTEGFISEAGIMIIFDCPSKKVLQYQIGQPLRWIEA
tara:strand:+ start:726 stop:836 length:111 start_codon:yes stop_codon:yes gene_type:complete